MFFSQVSIKYFALQIYKNYKYVKLFFSMGFLEAIDKFDLLAVKTDLAKLNAKLTLIDRR